MANIVYNAFKKDLLNKVYDLTNDTIKCALYQSNVTVVAATLTTYDQLTVMECPATSGYTAGGATLTGQAVTLNGVTGVWTAASVQWTSSTISAYYAVLYDTSATNRVICGFDFSGAQASSNGTFAIQWNAAGILNVTSS